MADQSGDGAATPGKGLAFFPTLAAYGVPQLPAAALLVVYGFFPVYYTQVLKLDYGVAATLVLLTRLWDVVTDPMVGILSDRLALPAGRRKPWLIMALPVVLPGVWAIFFAEPGMSPWLLGVWTFILYLGWSMIALPLNAWSVDLSGDYHERSRISATREAVGLVGTVIALAILGLGANAGDEGLARAFEILGIGLLIGFPITILITSLYVPDSPNPKGFRFAGMDEIRPLLGNRPLRYLAGAFLLNGLANGFPATLFVFFAQSVIGAPGQVGAIILVYFLSGIIGVPLWTRVSARLGKHRTWVISMGLAAVFFVPVILLGEGDLWPYIGVSVITGLCLGADLFLPPAIQADVVDEDALLSGQSRAGLYFSILGMIYKLALALAGGIALAALDVVGFDDAIGPANSETALLTLALLYGGVPSVLKLVAMVIMWRFPLDEAAQREARAKIGEAAIET